MKKLLQKCGHFLINFIVLVVFLAYKKRIFLKDIVRLIPGVKHIKKTLEKDK